MSHLTARQLYAMLSKRGFSDLRSIVALERVSSPSHAFLVLNALTRRMPEIFSALFVESDAFALGCRQVAIISGGIPNYVDLMKWLRERRYRGLLRLRRPGRNGAVAISDEDKEREYRRLLREIAPQTSR
jgi:hypothetical protein